MHRRSLHLASSGKPGYDNQLYQFTVNTIGPSELVRAGPQSQ